MAFASMIRPAVVMLLCGCLLFGLFYPLLVTGVAQVLFPLGAHGSIIMQGTKPVGSALIGQQFTSPKYFWGRPSAATPAYNAAASGASNLGPSNPDLPRALQGRVQVLKATDAGNTKPIPADLVEASASGLDPHISLQAAEYQVPRVARERGMPEAKLRDIVAQYTEAPQLGVLGQPRVNVLELNLALDAAKPR